MKYLLNQRQYGRLLLFLIAVHITIELPSQPGSTEPLKIKEAFIKAFNTGSSNEFREHFDLEMKKRNSLKRLNSTFASTAKKAGAISNMMLDEVDGKTYTYRSLHENLVTLKVVFELNKESQLHKMEISSEYDYKNAPKLERNTSDFILPFNGEWYTFWGGKSRSGNYHNAYARMLGAFDFWVMGDNGKSHRSGATRNEDFYAFGKSIIAPVDGKIIFAKDGIRDNNWPSMNSAAGYGNVIMLETENGEYLIFGHLKENSILVKKGQVVKQGERLAQCGNSGNSTEPHLHFQTQNLPDFAAATGAWTHFKKIKVNGSLKQDYIPTRRDKVSN